MSLLRATPERAAAGDGAAAGLDPQRAIGALVRAVERVIVGKPEVIRQAVVALLARGHLLIEDVPGVGKTTLAQSLARAIGGSFSRIQFTNDLLPADILGVAVYQRESGTFVFRPGPIFANVVLADEINRTTPKTQSCLLEAMNERQVSVEGETRPLPLPFFVVATQNPLEHHGTFPLPESQLDRFLMRIRIGYPSVKDEKRILAGDRLADPAEIEPVVTPADLVALQAEVERVRVDEAVRDYLMAIVSATRQSPLFALGASPRAALAFQRAAQAAALVDGRRYVLPDDLKGVAIPVLAHRLELAGAPGAGRAEVEGALADLLDRIPVPV
ncbi:MAG TPA: MoxR family ATPase [Thermodesulfobacteriota bacterium]|nr:MoxR family ATPase [Thermodesulfobacteriota bacterium]